MYLKKCSLPAILKATYTNEEAMVENKRKHPRLTVPMQVELSYADAESVMLTTRDISDGGVFLVSPEGKFPALNTQVQIKVKASLQGEEPQSIDATVVRVSEEGVGLKFDDS